VGARIEDWVREAESARWLGSWKRRVIVDDDGGGGRGCCFDVLRDTPF
jgi:hypothetical protein